MASETVAGQAVVAGRDGLQYPQVGMVDGGDIVTRGPARRVFEGTLDEDWRERSRIILA